MSSHSESIAQAELDKAVGKGQDKAPRKCIITPLVSIRSDEYSHITFETMETDERLSFYISQHDGADFNKSFFFADVYEAKAFATRMLEVLNGYI